MRQIYFLEDLEDLAALVIATEHERCCHGAVVQYRCTTDVVNPHDAPPHVSYMDKMVIAVVCCVFLAKRNAAYDTFHSRQGWKKFCLHQDMFKIMPQLGNDSD